MIFRLTQKLATKIHAGKLAEQPLDENPYADWSAHFFTADRTQYILLSNTKSLYSCVMFGKGITDEGQFIERALSTIREFMEDDGQAFIYERFIAPSSARVTFARALNRSVTGCMNDLVKFAQCALVEQEISPHDLGFKLNETPLSPLGAYTGRHYGTPKEAFKQVVEEGAWPLIQKLSQTYEANLDRKSSSVVIDVQAAPKLTKDRGVNYKFQMAQWLPLFPLKDDDGIFHAEIVTGPRQACKNEQLRREMQDQYDWGPAVPVDIFIMAKGEPEDRSVTKIAGLPYRPASAPWPNDSSGKPMQFLAQFNFGDSRDITGELPGDILLVFVDQGYLFEPDGELHFEWQPQKIKNVTQPEAMPKLPKHNYIEPCYGCIHRTLSYPKAKWAIPISVQVYSKCRGLNVFSDYHLLQWQATQIGTAPFYVQDIPKEWLPGRLLCTLSSVHPDQHTAYPFVNHPEPLMPDGQWASDTDYLMLADVGCLYISMDDEGKLYGQMAYY